MRVQAEAEEKRERLEREREELGQLSRQDLPAAITALILGKLKPGVEANKQTSWQRGVNRGVNVRGHIAGSASHRVMHSRFS